MGAELEEQLPQHENRLSVVVQESPESRTLVKKIISHYLAQVSEMAELASQAGFLLPWLVAGFSSC